MCSRNTSLYFRNMPKWLIIAITLLIITIAGLIAYYIVTNITRSYEKDSIDSAKDNEVTKGEVDDYKLNIHLEKHRANLEHERMVMKEHQEHEMAKINIILPICAVIVMIICGSCLMVYFKDKLPKLGNSATINKKLKPDMEVKMKPASIPKLRMDDFNQLIKFGFDVDDAASAINASNSFSSALDHLAIRNNTSKMIGNETGKEKTNADSENGIQTLKTEYVFIGDV